MQRPSRKAAPLFNDFVFAVVCGWDLEVYEWVIGWLADAVQNIDRTGETALVLRGGEGHGKNFFWNRLRELFGREHTMMVSSADALVGHFNSHLMNKTMVFANEAAFTKTMDQAGALRSLITDDTMLATPKGVDSMEVNKCFRVIFASNHDHIVQMSADDRRYCVLDVDAGDHRRDRDFFGEIYRAWNEGEREEFLWQLWHHDLASWDPNAIPETEARTAQKAASLPPPWAWLRQLLSGDIPFDAVDPDSGHVFVFSENIPKSQAPDWTRAIKAVGGATGKVTANGRQERGRWFPTRMDAMRRFHDKTGVGRDWLDQHHVWFSEIGDHPTGTSRARDVI